MQPVKQKPDTGGFAYLGSQRLVATEYLNSHHLEYNRLIQELNELDRFATYTRAVSLGQLRMQYLSHFFTVDREWAENHLAFLRWLRDEEGDKGSKQTPARTPWRKHCNWRR